MKIAHFRRLIGWTPYILLPIAAYFLNVQWQSHLGREAIKNTGLTMLSFEEALIKARAQNKPVLADLSAIWCPSCRKLDQEVLSNEQVKKHIMQNYVFARIEYESPEGKDFMSRYNAQGFPTLFVIDADGKQVKKLPLTFSPEQFIALL